MRKIVLIAVLALLLSLQVTNGQGYSEILREFSNFENNLQNNQGLQLRWKISTEEAILQLEISQGLLFIGKSSQQGDSSLLEKYQLQFEDLLKSIYSNYIPIPGFGETYQDKIYASIRASNLTITEEIRYKENLIDILRSNRDRQLREVVTQLSELFVEYYESLIPNYDPKSSTQNNLAHLDQHLEKALANSREVMVQFYQIEPQTIDQLKNFDYSKPLQNIIESYVQDQEFRVRLNEMIKESGGLEQFLQNLQSNDQFWDQLFKKRNQYINKAELDFNDQIDKVTKKIDEELIPNINPIYQEPKEEKKSNTFSVLVGLSVCVGLMVFGYRYYRRKQLEENDIERYSLRK